MQTVSLLNSVIGPIMRGPSSSHSAAPFHIANAIRELAIGPIEEIKSVDIAFDPSGSFAAVYTNQGSDEGFAAGFLGLEITDHRYREALSTFTSGRTHPLVFRIAPLADNDHPNRTHVTVCVRQENGTERADQFRAVSTGGGMFIIDGVGGHSVVVDGTAWSVLVEGRSSELNKAPKHAGLAWPAPRQYSPEIAQFDLTTEPTGADLALLRALPEVTRVRVSSPAALCVVSAETMLSSGADLLARGPHLDLASEALAVEARRLGLSLDEVRAHFESRLNLMLSSVKRGLDADTSADGMKFLRPKAPKVASASLPPILTGTFTQNAIAGALAIMEQNTNRGIVVAAPTAGSAGIVPGVLYGLSRAGVRNELLVDSLQVMALVGGIFALRGSFAAETGGCSVETGISAAMAAAGFAHAMGANAEEAFNAASLCLMNTLGLVCDPVAGEVEIPCHARNIAGVAHAHSAVVATLAGFDAVMPFDSMVLATNDVGEKMHPDLRCTSRGGCAKFHTPSARQSRTDGRPLIPLTNTR